jgi:hypothetical protein
LPDIAHETKGGNGDIPTHFTPTASKDEYTLSLTADDNLGCFDQASAPLTAPRLEQSDGRGGYQDQEVRSLSPRHLTTAISEAWAITQSSNPILPDGDLAVGLEQFDEVCGEPFMGAPTDDPWSPAAAFPEAYVPLSPPGESWQTALDDVLCPWSMSASSVESAA